MDGLKGLSVVLALTLMALSVVSADSLSLDDLPSNELDVTLCTILVTIGDALEAIGPTIVLLMFLYGGVKYVYSSGDPGGRKQAKSIVIHAVIAGILISVTFYVVGLVGIDATLCNKFAK